ncbi:hypothetical protein BGZ96_000996 [Linnemannia gamsii]|uniref:J domain-containing protein n=1 Tax=Linnemannia gamsii TaxID=64522 RepID=A0ABQ7JN30_9FUNG|nr:hypothetical protein BGZ96_000996 [Linnemannia gamsii]
MSRLLFTRATATTATPVQPSLRRHRSLHWQELSIPTLITPFAFSSSHSYSNFHTSTHQSAQHHHKTNHYERLGLTENATKKEIKTHFYKLSKLHHPDKNASEASRHEFLAINEAYSILGDDRRRRDYDLTLRDRTGSLYSNSSSSTSGSNLRGSLRRTPFRHSAQSAAAAAAARQHAGSRSTFGMGGVSGGSGGGGGGGGGPVPHFDSKSHQEMHYEQELRQEERRQARERESEDAKWRKTYEESDSATGKIFRVSFVFLSILAATSFMKAFAEENEDEQDQEDPRGRSYYRSSWVLSKPDQGRSHHYDNRDDARISVDPSFNCDLG